MARTVTTSVDLTDDIDGSKADETVAFGFDGTSYEIELSKKNAAALTKTFKPYLAAARKVPAPRGRRGGSAAKKSAPARRADLADIRAWAAAAGHAIADRGRIPTTIIDAYDAR